jgi:hypothetical protein
MPKSVKEICSSTDDYARFFENADPALASAIDPQVLRKLRGAAKRKVTVERELLEAVSAARHSGASWALIGALLGTSGEAARQKYGHFVGRASQPRKRR